MQRPSWRHQSSCFVAWGAKVSPCKRCWMLGSSPSMLTNIQKLRKPHLDFCIKLFSLGLNFPFIPTLVSSVSSIHHRPIWKTNFPSLLVDLPDQCWFRFLTQCGINLSTQCRTTCKHGTPEQCRPYETCARHPRTTQSKCIHVVVYAETRGHWDSVLLDYGCAVQ